MQLCIYWFHTRVFNCFKVYIIVSKKVKGYFLIAYKLVKGLFQLHILGIELEKMAV